MNRERVDALAKFILWMVFVLSAMFSISAVVVVSAYIGKGPLVAIFASMGVVLVLAKMALPAVAYKLWLRKAMLPAQITAGIWLFPFLLCCAASYAFVVMPHVEVDGRLGKEISRKEDAMRSMKRTLRADGDIMDDSVYDSYEKRIKTLKSEISELRTQEPAKIIHKVDGLYGGLFGVVGVVIEAINSLCLVFLLWANTKEREPVVPEPALVKVEPLPEVTPMLITTGPAFLPAADKIDPSKATAWLWRNVVPLGALTLLTGQPKVGKSQIAIQATAITSAGGTWPDGRQAEAGNVILMEVEDSAADTQARLMAAGADLKRIAIRDSEAGPLDLSSPEGVELLKAHAAAMGGVKLVVVSPALAFFGKAGVTDDAMVRQRIEPLRLWAAQNRIAVLMITHPAKNAGKSLEAQFAGADGFRRAARSAYVAMVDASDPDPIIKRKRRVLVCAGVNGGDDTTRFFYRIEGVEVNGASTSRVKWVEGPGGGEPDFEEVGEIEEVGRESVAEANGSEVDVTGKIATWMKGVLSRGGVSQTELFDRAKQVGFKSSEMLNRAADVLGVVKIPKSGFGGKGKWVLPGTPEANEYLATLQAAE